MVRPVVHIGYHKTATTWFQNAFYPAVRNLRFVPRSVARQALLAPDALAFDPQAARAALGLGAGLPVAICEENLSGYIHNGGLSGCLTKDVAYRLKATLPDARIVIFLRAQPAMIVACYQQYLRGGGTHKPRRYLFPGNTLHGAYSHAYKAPRFSFDHFDYDSRIALYEGLFGAENVHVLLYERLNAERDAFLEDFAARLGLDIDPRDVGQGRDNQSYRSRLLPLARFLNRFTRRSVIDKRHWLHFWKWYDRRTRLLATLNRSTLAGPPPTLAGLVGETAAKEIAARYTDGNARLEVRRPLGLKHWGYPMPSRP